MRVFRTAAGPIRIFKRFSKTRLLFNKILSCSSAPARVNKTHGDDVRTDLFSSHNCISLVIVPSRFSGNLNADIRWGTGRIRGLGRTELVAVAAVVLSRHGLSIMMVQMLP